MKDEIKKILDYFQKDVDKYEESKRYLMQKYGYDEETIDNISQHERHINTKILLDYITNLEEENERLTQGTTVLTNKIIDMTKENKILKENAIHNDKVVDKAKWNEMIYKSRCEKSLKALHNSKEYKVMKELEFNKNMSILIKLDKLLSGDE